MTTRTIPISGEHLTEFRKPFERIDDLEAENKRLREQLGDQCLDCIAADERAEKAEALTRYLDHKLRAITRQFESGRCRNIAHSALDRTDLADFLAREKTNG